MPKKILSLILTIILFFGIPLQASAYLCNDKTWKIVEYRGEELYFREFFWVDTLSQFPIPTNFEFRGLQTMYYEGMTDCSQYPNFSQTKKFEFRFLHPNDKLKFALNFLLLHFPFVVTGKTHWFANSDKLFHLYFYSREQYVVPTEIVAVMILIALTSV